MLRFILSIFCFLYLFHSTSFSQNEHENNYFILSGKLAGMDTGSIVLWYPDLNGHHKKDTVAVINGSFQFKRQVKQPVYAHLLFPYSHGKSLSFFLEKGEQNIFIGENKDGDFNMAGSFTQNQEDTLKGVIKAIKSKYKDWIDEHFLAVRAWLEINDSTKKLQYEEKIIQLEKRNAVIEKEILNAKLSFILNYPSSYVSPTYLYGLLINRQIKSDSAEFFYSRFSTPIQMSNVGLLIAEELNKRRINIKATNINTKDINNEPIQLSDFNGQYVLLNFWASWCIPCIEKIPELIRLFEYYNPKGFKIINISIDENKKLWINSVKKYKVEEFINLLADEEININYTNTKQPIPSAILINRGGIIIWNSLNLGSEPLEKILEKEMNN